MHFCSWYRAQDIAVKAPHEPGVFQVRGQKLRDYPRGKSAMLHYASATDLADEMRRWAAATAHTLGSSEGDDERLFRHASDLGSRSPQEALARVLDRFVDRFGSPPSFGQ